MGVEEGRKGLLVESKGDREDPFSILLRAPSMTSLLDWCHNSLWPQRMHSTPNCGKFSYTSEHGDIVGVNMSKTVMLPTDCAASAIPYVGDESLHFFFPCVPSSYVTLHIIVSFLNVCVFSHAVTTFLTFSHKNWWKRTQSFQKFSFHSVFTLVWEVGIIMYVRFTYLMYLYFS